MRITYLATVLFFLTAASTAFGHGRDEDRWYLGLGIGAVGAPDIDENPTGTVGYDPGITGSLLIGRDLGGSDDVGFAAEFEGFLSDYKLEEEDLGKIPSAISDDAGTLAWLVNGVIDWHIAEQFGFYGAAGIGYASTIEFEFYDSGNLNQEDKHGLAWQLKLGLQYNLGGSYDFLLGYRYLQTEDVEVRNTVTQATFDVPNEQHVFELGVRWGL